VLSVSNDDSGHDTAQDERNALILLQIYRVSLRRRGLVLNERPCHLITVIYRTGRSWRRCTFQPCDAVHM